MTQHTGFCHNKFMTQKLPPKILGKKETKNTNDSDSFNAILQGLLLISPVNITKKHVDYHDFTTPPMFLQVQDSDDEGKTSDGHCLGRKMSSPFWPFFFGCRSFFAPWKNTAGLQGFGPRLIALPFKCFPLCQWHRWRFCWKELLLKMKDA